MAVIEATLRNALENLAHACRSRSSYAEYRQATAAAARSFRTLSELLDDGLTPQDVRNLELPAWPVKGSFFFVGSDH